MTDSHYVHGTSAEEQSRLSRMNELLNATSLAEIGVEPGARVLDLGSGLGQLTRGFARAAGSHGFVVGVERSPEQLAEALAQARHEGEAGAVDFRLGDVLAPPLAEDEWGSFDVVHGRFILEHVPDPLAVVRTMVRAASPGGRLVLEDDDHDVLRVWPEVPGLERMWGAYLRTYARAGNDAYVGRKLVALLHEAGARPQRNRWLFFGACAGEAEFPDYVENLARIFEGARAAIVSGGDATAAEVDGIAAALRAWRERPDAAIWFARCWAEGVSR